MRPPQVKCMTFNDEEIERYARHLVLREVGGPGQQKLKAASALIVGAGGLGAPAALYLAAAGFGTILLADPDEVDVSNLQRQVIYASDDLGRPKVEAAADRLHALNPHVFVAGFNGAFTAETADELVDGVDLVLDGTDDFAVRYCVNDACVRHGKPLVYGAVHRFEGQVSVFAPPQGPCYRCLFPEPPRAEDAPNCAEAGVLGVVPGIVGLLQTNEAIKLVLGLGESLVGRLLHIDARTARFREVRLPRDPQCPGCGPEAPRSGPYRDYVAVCAATA